MICWAYPEVQRPTCPKHSGGTAGEGGLTSAMLPVGWGPQWRGRAGPVPLPVLGRPEAAALQRPPRRSVATAAGGAGRGGEGAGAA